jgi:site-specific DNA recombinase
MRTYFAYIRVSTVKQGEKGSSLTEQRDAIERYAIKQGLCVTEWFEEQETAAKRGRTVFRKMLTRLKKGSAHGLVMHKVDRGARNLADWAELASLMDLGIDVHFAHEALDLTSRGGRLSADIQAVVAADFIRNLRDEVKKGLYGRLKQGVYPFKAPPGYCDNGSGALKTIDPVTGPLVRQAFELYASGNYTLNTLRAAMAVRGLRTRSGNTLSAAQMSEILSNRFYYGLMCVKGQTFVGKYEPLISKTLFDKVRSQAEGRTPCRSTYGRDYALRKMIFCGSCGRGLYGELQKGFIYYRCHGDSCAGVCIRETRCAEEAAHILSYLPEPPVLLQTLREMFDIENAKQSERRVETEKSIALQTANVEARERRITDLFIEGALDQAVYDSRRVELQNKRLSLREMLKSATAGTNLAQQTQNFLELVLSLRRIAQTQFQLENREMLKTAVSNFTISQKSVTIQWSKAFEVLLNLGGVCLCEESPKDFRKRGQYVTVRNLLPPCEESLKDFRKRGQSVTVRNILPPCEQSPKGVRRCMHYITDRDEAFNQGLRLHGEALYLAVLADNRFNA